MQPITTIFKQPETAAL